MNFLLNKNNKNHSLTASIIYDIFSLGYMFFIILAELFNIKISEFSLGKIKNGYNLEHFEEDMKDLKRIIEISCRLQKNNIQIQQLFELLRKMIHPDRTERFQKLDDLIHVIDEIYITI